MKRRTFIAGLLVALAASAPAAPSGAASPLAPAWRRVTLENAQCRIDMPGALNVRRVERIEQAQGSGVFAAEGVAATGGRGVGMFVVISAVTTKFAGKPKDLRRFMGLLSLVVDAMLRKEFAKSLTLQEKRPVACAGGEGTDYIYRVPGERFAVRLRKLALADRAYFIIAIGAPADARRFVESIEPLPAGFGNAGQTGRRSLR